MVEEGRNSGAEAGALVLSLEQSRLRHALPIVARRAMGFTARHRFDELLLMAVRHYYGLDLDLCGVEHEILDDDDQRIRFLPWFLWDWRAAVDEPSVGEEFLVTCEHTSLDSRLLQGLCDSFVGFYLALDSATRSGVWLLDMTTGRRIHVADEGLEGELFEGQVLQARLVEIESDSELHFLVDAVYAILPPKARPMIEAEMRSLLTPGCDPVAEMKESANELIVLAERVLEALSRPPCLTGPMAPPLLLCQTTVRSEEMNALLDAALRTKELDLAPVGERTFLWRNGDGLPLGFIEQETTERWQLGAISRDHFDTLRNKLDPEGTLPVPLYSLTDVEAVAERWITVGGGERWIEWFPQVESAVRDWVGFWTQGWADRPVLSLGHRTPREAMRRSEGRRLVERLVREFEMDYHMWFEGQTQEDFTGLRRELGLV